MCLGVSWRVGLRPTGFGVSVCLMPTTQEIAKRVRLAIADKGISQKDIAEALHMSPSALGRRVNGQRQISAAEIYGIAKILGVEVGDLLE